MNVRSLSSWPVGVGNVPSCLSVDFKANRYPNGKIICKQIIIKLNTAYYFYTQLKRWYYQSYFYLFIVFGIIKRIGYAGRCIK